MTNRSLLIALLLLAPACGGGTNPLTADADKDGFSINDGDCNDTNAQVYPGATERCDALDNNCDSTIDEGFDSDRDGFTSCGGDCRDNDPGSNPTGVEIIDGFDNDCDGIVDNHTNQYDDDGDGFSEDQGDCDDSESGQGPLTGPNALEVQLDPDGNPEGIDNDCDGLIDEAILPCPVERNVADPLSYAHAIDVCHEVSSASWSSSIAIDPSTRGIFDEFGPSYGPRMGDDFIGLSSGIVGPNADDLSTSFPYSTAHPAPLPDPADGCGQADGATVNDYSEVKLTMEVPQNAKAFSFDFNFMSIEFPEYVCSNFDDTFLAILDSQAFQGNVSFDSQGNVVSINIGFFDVCAPDAFYATETANCGGEAELVGTGFEQSANGGGGTGWLTTTAPVVPGEKITLTFMIFDEGDHILDSTVLIDNFRWELDEVTGPITIERQPASDLTQVHVENFESPLRVQ